MRTILERLILALLVLSGAAGGAAAAFEDMPISPRAAAMGGAALSSDGDSTALFMNPASLSGAKSGDAYFMYDRLYAGLQGAGSIGQGLISASVPTPWGVVAAGVGTLNAQGLENEREIGLSYARRFGSFGVGVTGKQLYQNYMVGGDPLASSDPVFSHGTSRSAFSFDAGLVYDSGDPLKLGLAVRNLNSPNVGLASVDAVPRQLQASAAYLWPHLGLRATADLLYTAQPAGAFQDRVVPSLGVEKAFYDGRAAFRMGLSTLGLSAGVGVRLGPVGLDYALVIARAMLNGNFGTQMLGLSYHFGGGASGGAYAQERAAPPAAPPFAPVRPVANPALSVPYEPL